jgi:hypothetical protein
VTQVLNDETHVKSGIGSAGSVQISQHPFKGTPCRKIGKEGWVLPMSQTYANQLSPQSSPWNNANESTRNDKFLVVVGNQLEILACFRGSHWNEIAIQPSIAWYHKKVQRNYQPHMGAAASGIRARS